MVTLSNARPKHECFSLYHTKHIQATEEFITNEIKEKLLQQPEYTPKDIVMDIKRDLSVEITYLKA